MRDDDALKPFFVEVKFNTVVMAADGKAAERLAQHVARELVRDDGLDGDTGVTAQSTELRSLAHLKRLDWTWSAENCAYGGEHPPLSEVLPEEDPPAPDTATLPMFPEAGAAPAGRGASGDPAELKPGHYVIRHNDDGEFGQKTGWLWRDGGHPCIVTGKPVYVWRPLDDLLAQTRHTIARLDAAQPAQGEPTVRFCPGCGSVGPVPAQYRDCCPDGGHARVIPESLANRCRDLFLAALDAAAGQGAGAAPVDPKPVLLMGIGKINGDGVKDTTRIGDVVYVWNRQLPEPYAPGQYPRVGYPIWSASTEQYDFRPVPAADTEGVLDHMLEEQRAEIGKLQDAMAVLTKAERRAVLFGDIMAQHICAMRAAVVAGELESPEAGLAWISNTLRGPGYLPDIEEARELGGAQALFDQEVADLEAFRAAHPAPAEPLAATAAVQVDEEWLRAKFDAYITRDGRWPHNAKRDPDGTYVLTKVRVRWETWKAAFSRLFHAGAITAETPSLLTATPIKGAWIDGGYVIVTPAKGTAPEALRAAIEDEHKVVEEGDSATWHETVDAGRRASTSSQEQRS